MEAAPTLSEKESETDRGMEAAPTLSEKESETDRGMEAAPTLSEKDADEKEFEASATSKLRMSEMLGDEQSDVLDYLAASSRDYGLNQVSQVHSIAYFLPLLRELFNVNDARVKVVFTMLYTLMVDDRVRWSRVELDEKFHWLKDGQRNYLLHRLSNVGWLEYYRDQGVYMITDKGEALMRILSRFTMGEELVENEGAALAEIEFSMLLDFDDLPDRLKFLRNRLAKHNIRAENALESDSAYRVLEVYQQLQSAYRWAEQTRKTLDEIESLEIDFADDDAQHLLDQWDAVRSVHTHLSMLHSQISEMQLALQDIQKRQINIAKYGLTHLDFDSYLINASVETLADLMLPHLQKIPHPLLVIEDIMFGEAEDILTRELPEAPDRVGWDLDLSDAPPESHPSVAYEAEEFSRALKRAATKWQDVSDVVNTEVWEVAAYRFQLMTMLADLRVLERMADMAFDPLIDADIEAEFDKKGKLIEVPVGDETRLMTKGRFRRLDIPTEEDVEEAVTDE